MSRRGRRIAPPITAVASVVALALAACAGPAPTPVATSLAPASPAALAPSASPAPSASGPVSSASDAAPSPAASGGVRVDDALLALLPAEVGGVPLTPDRETAAGLATDPTLEAAVSAIAVATAFGPLATDGSADYVVVTVVRLQPGAYSDGFFRDWRDSFDGAVCEQAGGVSGHAEAEFGGHPTWIGTCAGGAHTYHATLQDDTVIVSLQGAGAGRFGEQVVAGLTE